MAERFFFYLHRINAVFLFVLLWFGAIALAREWMISSAYDDPIYNDGAPYGTPGLDDEAAYDGEEIELTDGAVVKYVAAGEGDFDIKAFARNVSLTHGVTGQSRLVLAPESEQIVLRFEHIGSNGLGGQPATAYMVLAGTREDYAAGRLDLIVGRLSDLEQRVVAKRIRFVDSPRMIDDNTLAIIVWPAADRAEFWLFDLRTMAKTLSHPVQLPLPEKAKD